MYTTKQRLLTKVTASAMSAVMSVSALSSGLCVFAEEYGGIKYQSNGVHLGMSGDEFLDDDFVKGSVPPEIAPIVDAGMSALSDILPGGSIVTSYLKMILDDMLGGDDPDPTAESINQLREEINSRLDEIESHMEQDKNEILDQFTNDLYTQGLGHALDEFNTQVGSMTTMITTNSASETLTPNEIAVENAYLIGNNSDWLKAGNVVFDLNALSKTLTGESFMKTDNRDIYEVIYDANKYKYMFSGEVYDASMDYVNDIMYVYLNGCGVVTECLNYSRIVSELTPEEVEALSPIVRAHYDACAIAEPQHIYDEMTLMANTVYDKDSEDSVVSHYGVFCWKQRYLRNVFLNKGKDEPVVIDSAVDTIYYEFTEYDTSGEEKENEQVRKYCSEVKQRLQDAEKRSALTPVQINELAEYFIARSPEGGFYDYLYDMCGIVCNFPNDKTAFPIAVDGRTSSVYEKSTEETGYRKRCIRFTGVKDKGEKGTVGCDWLPYLLEERGSYSDVYHFSWDVTTTCRPLYMALFRKGKYPELPKTAEEAMQRSTKIEISYRDPNDLPFPPEPPKPVTKPSTITMGKNKLYVILPYQFSVSPYIDIVLTQNGETSKLTDASLELIEPGQDESQSSPISDGNISADKHGSYHVRAKYHDSKSHRDIYSNWLEILVQEGYCNDDSNNEDDDEYDEESGSIQCIVTGEYTGVVNSDAESLNDVLNIEYLSGNDEDGKGHTWGSLEDDGIIIDDNGKVTFTEPGTYHVRMIDDTGETMSNWAEIKAIVPEVPVKPSHGPAYIPQGGGSAVSLASSAENTSSSSSSSRASSKRRSPIDGKKIAYTIGADGIVLTWDKVNKAQSYTVFLLRGGKAIKLAETKDTSYTYTGAKTGEKYVFMVKYTTKDRPGLSRASESYRITVSTSAKKPAVSASAKNSKVR